MDRRDVRSQVVGDQSLGDEGIFPQRLPHPLQRGVLVSLGLDQYKPRLQRRRLAKGRPFGRRFSDRPRRGAKSYEASGDAFAGRPRSSVRNDGPNAVPSRRTPPLRVPPASPRQAEGKPKIRPIAWSIMSGGSGYPSQLIFAIPLATKSTEGPQVRRGVTMPSALMRRIPTACDDRQQVQFLCHACRSKEHRRSPGYRYRPGCASDSPIRLNSRPISPISCRRARRRACGQGRR